MSDTYVTTAVIELKFALQKPQRVFYVLSSKKLSVEEEEKKEAEKSQPPVQSPNKKTADIPNHVPYSEKIQYPTFPKIRHTFQLSKQELDTESFTVELFVKSGGFSNTDVQFAAVTIPFKDIVNCHFKVGEVVRDMIDKKQKPVATVTVLSLSSGNKLILDYLKSDDEKLKEIAMTNLKEMCEASKNNTPQATKIGMYINENLINELSSQVDSLLPSSAQRSAVVKKDKDKDKEKKSDKKKDKKGDKSDKSDKSEKTDKSEKKKTYKLKDEDLQTFENIRLLWTDLVNVSPNHRALLVKSGMISVIHSFLYVPVEKVQLTFLEWTKPFFTFGGHQKLMVKEGILETLIDFVGSKTSSVPLQFKALEVLLYFDEEYQKTMLQHGFLGKLFLLLSHTDPQLQTKALELVQYFDARYQDEIITQGFLKQMFELLSISAKRGEENHKYEVPKSVESLVVKSLSVIQHFDASHQNRMIEEGVLPPLISLLGLPSKKIKLKTLEVIYHFDVKCQPLLVDNGFLTYIPKLLSEEDLEIKIKAMSALEIFKSQMDKLLEAGLIKGLIDTLGHKNYDMALKAFMLVDSIGATQEDMYKNGITVSLAKLLEPTEKHDLVARSLTKLLSMDKKYYDRMYQDGVFEKAVEMVKSPSPAESIKSKCMELITNMSTENIEEAMKNGYFKLLLHVVQSASESRIHTGSTIFSALSNLVKNSVKYRPEDEKEVSSIKFFNKILSFLNVSSQASETSDLCLKYMDWMTEKKYIYNVLKQNPHAFDEGDPVCFNFDWDTNYTLASTNPSNIGSENLVITKQMVSSKASSSWQNALGNTKLPQEGVHRWSFEVTLGTEYGTGIYVGICDPTFPVLGDIIGISYKGTSCCFCFTVTGNNTTLSNYIYQNARTTYATHLKSGDQIHLTYYANGKYISLAINDNEYGLMGPINATCNFVPAVTMNGRGTSLKIIPPVLPKPKKQNIEDIEFKYQNQMNEWISQSFKPPHEWTLLYKASVHGYSNRMFHLRCNDCGPTAVIAELNTGYVFGGFTSHSWDDTTRYSREFDNHEFIFNLSDGRGGKPFKVIPGNPQRPYGSVAGGPISFGNNDMYIDLNYLTNSYGISMNVYNVLPNHNSVVVTGTYNGWNFKDVEVWGIKKFQKKNIENYIELLNSSSVVIQDHTRKILEKIEAMKGGRKFIMNSLMSYMVRSKDKSKIESIMSNYNSCLDFLQYKLVGINGYNIEKLLIINQPQVAASSSSTTTTTTASPTSAQKILSTPKLSKIDKVEIFIEAEKDDDKKAADKKDGDKVEDVKKDGDDKKDDEKKDEKDDKKDDKDDKKDDKDDKIVKKGEKSGIDKTDIKFWEEKLSRQLNLCDVKKITSSSGGYWYPNRDHIMHLVYQYTPDDDDDDDEDDDELPYITHAILRKGFDSGAIRRAVVFASNEMPKVSLKHQYYAQISSKLFQKTFADKLKVTVEPSTEGGEDDVDYFEDAEFSNTSSSNSTSTSTSTTTTSDDFKYNIDEDSDSDFELDMDLEPLEMYMKKENDKVSEFLSSKKRGKKTRSLIKPDLIEKQSDDVYDDEWMSSYEEFSDEDDEEKKEQRKIEAEIMLEKKKKEEADKKAAKIEEERKKNPDLVTVMDAGFDYEIALQAVQRYPGNVERAMNALVDNPTQFTVTPTVDITAPSPFDAVIINKPLPKRRRKANQANRKKPTEWQKLSALLAMDDNPPIAFIDFRKNNTIEYAFPRSTQAKYLHLVCVSKGRRETRDPPSISYVGFIGYHPYSLDSTESHFISKPSNNTTTTTTTSSSSLLSQIKAKKNEMNSGDYPSSFVPLVFRFDEFVSQRDHNGNHIKLPHSSFLVFPDTEVIQWVSQAVVSSSYGSGWSGDCLVGPPRVYPQHGDFRGAWAASTSNGTIETLTVQIDTPVYLTGVHIFETFNPGHVLEIKAKNNLTGETKIVYKSDQDPIPRSPEPTTARIFSPSFRPVTSYKIESLEISIDQRQSAGWAEIDCIAVCGCTVKPDVTDSELDALLGDLDAELKSKTEEDTKIEGNISIKTDEKGEDKPDELDKVDKVDEPKTKPDKTTEDSEEIERSEEKSDDKDGEDKTDDVPKQDKADDSDDETKSTEPKTTKTEDDESKSDDDDESKSSDEEVKKPKTDSKPEVQENDDDDEDSLEEEKPKNEDDIKISGMIISSEKPETEKDFIVSDKTEDGDTSVLKVKSEDDDDNDDVVDEVQKNKDSSNKRRRILQPSDFVEVAKSVGFTDDIKLFAYNPTNDRTGIIYWFGCNMIEGSNWSNPTSRGVKSLVSIKPNTPYTLSNICTFGINTYNVDVRSNAVAGYTSTTCGFTLSFTQHSIFLTKCLLRNGYRNSCRKMILEGSKDGNEFFLIHQEEWSADWTVSYQHKLMEPECDTFYSHFKFSFDTPAVNLSGVELYGTVLGSTDPVYNNNNAKSKKKTKIPKKSYKNKRSSY
eukprot:TRINITY_DN341_c1_g1_i3.p1 TRINITY_DN341_c1_g1~~TRINITY_DN341_c1_g1_i3.p1  ORF type:complete len:2445 (+),score=763.48 TRINITY_DN341_c1_g1_i3:71-7405(+)